MPIRKNKMGLNFSNSKYKSSEKLIKFIEDKRRDKEQGVKINK